MPGKERETKIQKNFMKASLGLKFNTRKDILSHQGAHDLFFEKNTSARSYQLESRVSVSISPHPSSLQSVITHL